MKLWISNDSGASGSSGTEAQEFSSPLGGTIVGARNSANRNYTLAHTPLSAAQLKFYIDGVLVDPNLVSFVGPTVTLAASVPAPSAAQTLVADYFY